jgi:ABC-type transport system involved in multi-copper enzyme maturation permease subunit
LERVQQPDEDPRKSRVAGENMMELVRANVLADFAFYRRSRVLFAFLLVFLLLMALSSLPPLFYQSGVQTFNVLQSIFNDLNEFLLFFAGGLGLFIISSHIRSRSLKMVFTKPCSPAVWLSSALLSATAVSGLLVSVVFAGAMVFSLVWHLPVSGGLAFISAETFVVSIQVIAYLMLLTTLVHPAIAVALALVFNAKLFYEMQTWAQAMIRSGNKSMWLHAIERVFHFFYVVLPMFGAFGNKTENAHSSLRVSQGDWKYVLYEFGYTVALSAFCYFVALFLLQRRKHI